MNVYPSIQAVLLPWFYHRKCFILSIFVKSCFLICINIKCVCWIVIYVCECAIIFWSIRTNNLKIDAHFKMNKRNKRKHSLLQWKKHIKRKNSTHKIRHDIFCFFLFRHRRKILSEKKTILKSLTPMQIMVKSKAIHMNVSCSSHPHQPPTTTKGKRKYIWARVFLFACIVFRKCQQYLYSQLHYSSIFCAFHSTYNNTMMAFFRCYGAKGIHFGNVLIIIMWKRWRRRRWNCGWL